MGWDGTAFLALWDIVWDREFTYRTRKKKTLTNSLRFVSHCCCYSVKNKGKRKLVKIFQRSHARLETFAFVCVKNIEAWDTQGIHLDYLDHGMGWDGWDLWEKYAIREDTDADGKVCSSHPMPNTVHSYLTGKGLDADWTNTFIDLATTLEGQAYVKKLEDLASFVGK